MMMNFFIIQKFSSFSFVSYIHFPCSFFNFSMYLFPFLKFFLESGIPQNLLHVILDKKRGNFILHFRFIGSMCTYVGPGTNSVLVLMAGSEYFCFLDVGLIVNKLCLSCLFG